MAYMYLAYTYVISYMDMAYTYSMAYTHIMVYKNWNTRI